MIGGMN